MYLSMDLYNLLNTLLLVSTLKGLNVSPQRDIMQCILGEMRIYIKPLK